MSARDEPGISAWRQGIAGERSPEVWTYGAIALAVIAVFAAVGMRPVQSGRSEVRQVQADDLALRRVLDLRATLADLQVFIEPHLALRSTTASRIDPGDMARAPSSVTRRRVRL